VAPRAPGGPAAGAAPACLSEGLGRQRHLGPAHGVILVAGGLAHLVLVGASRRGRVAAVVRVAPAFPASYFGMKIVIAEIGTKVWSGPVSERASVLVAPREWQWRQWREVLEEMIVNVQVVFIPPGWRAWWWTERECGRASRHRSAWRRWRHRSPVLFVFGDFPSRRRPPRQ
jgi:hypothetical protein